MVATKFRGIHSKSPLTTPKIKERRVHEMHESTWKIWKRSPQRRDAMGVSREVMLQRIRGLTNMGDWNKDNGHRLKLQTHWEQQIE